MINESFLNLKLENYIKSNIIALNNSNTTNVINIVQNIFTMDYRKEMNK